MQALLVKFKSLSRAGVLRSVGVLVGGTALAQALTVLVLPAVTRLYTPADFSVLAVFSSVLAVISVVACLRLEIAIPIPEKDDDAANLLALALCFCTAVAALAGLAVWLLSTQIIDLLGQPKLQPFLWLLPMGIWLTSASTAVQFWATRKKKFAAIAKTRMSQAIGGASAQLGLGWWPGFGPLGLLLGQLISSGAGLFSLGRAALREDRFALHSISRLGMRRMLREYSRFPKYSTFEAFANIAGIQVPIIIIAAMAIGPDAGYLLLASRAMAIPLGLIGSAVSQVYVSNASTEMRNSNLAIFTSEIIAGLLRGGVGPLIFAGIVAPVVFPLIFGESWRRAGELITWMTPWFVLQFLASPITLALNVMGRQRAALNLQIFGLVVRVSAVVIAGLILHTRVAETYAISSFIFYCVNFYVVIFFTEIKFASLYRKLIESGLYILPWAFFGILLRIILGL